MSQRSYRMFRIMDPTPNPPRTPNDAQIRSVIAVYGKQGIGISDLMCQIGGSSQDLLSALERLTSIGDIVVVPSTADLPPDLRRWRRADTSRDIVSVNMPRP